MIRRAQQVRDAADRLAYRPNSAAQATVTGRFRMIGLLQSQVAPRSTLPMPLLDGLCDELGRLDYALTITRLPESRPGDSADVPRVLRALLVDGLLVNYTDHIPQQMLELIRSHDRPAIWLNTQLPSDCLYPDDLSAGRDATRVLLDLGHRRITYLDFGHGTQTLAHDHYSARDRSEGYTRAMRAAGLEPRIIRFELPQTLDSIATWLPDFLRNLDRPTAMVGYGMHETTSVLIASLQLGLKPGRDLSLVHMHAGGELAAVQVGEFRISRMEVDLREMAAQAVRMLLKRMSSPTQKLKPRVLTFKYMPGNTVAAPPRLN